MAAIAIVVGTCVGTEVVCGVARFVGDTGGVDTLGPVGITVGLTTTVLVGTALATVG